MANCLSLIEHLADVKGAKITGYDDTNLKSHNVLVLDIVPTQTHVCPFCGRVCPGYDYASKTPKLWRHTDWGSCVVMFRYRPRRIKCPEHKVVTESVPWAHHKTRFSKAFEKRVLGLGQHTSRFAVSQLMRIDWHTTDRCIERFLLLHANVTQTSRFDGLKHIAIDETSYQKRHKYVTCVLNQENNTIIWVGEGHGLATIKQFFEQLTPEQRASIETVSGDGARWIDACVTAYVPHAKRCADPFHIILWASDALDSVRLRASRELRKKGNAIDAKAIKGSQIALGKDPSELTEKQKAKVKLVSEKTPGLYNAYQLKEKLRKIISMKRNPEEAIKALDEWIELAKSSEELEFQNLAEKISRHRQNIINTIQYNKHSARLEAINNSIKLIIRRSYGFRNTDNLANHIIFCCSSTKIELAYPTHHTLMTA